MLVLKPENPSLLTEQGARRSEELSKYLEWFYIFPSLTWPYESMFCLEIQSTITQKSAQTLTCDAGRFITGEFTCVASHHPAQEMVTLSFESPKVE